MFRFRLFCALLAAAAISLSLSPLPSLAQAPVAAPTTVTAPTPAATSTFARYQKYNVDEPLTDWRKANDTVREIGGWRVYLKEAMQANEAREAREAAAKSEAKK